MATPPAEIDRNTGQNINTGAVVSAVLAQETKFRLAYATASVGVGHASDEEVVKKFQLARILIEDGRFTDFEFLVKNYLPRRGKVSEVALQHDKDLRVMCFERGYIEPGQKGEERTEEALMQYLKTDPTLSQLQEQGVPAPVLNQIAYNHFCNNLTDEGKRKHAASMVRKAFLRKYMGDIKVHRHYRRVDLPEILKVIPDKIFEEPDEVTINILRDYFMHQVFRFFRGQTENMGFAHLNDLVNREASEVKKNFLKSIQTELREVQKLHIPPVFNDKLPGWPDGISPFPMFLQKYIIGETLKSGGRKLLNGGTAAGKTGVAYATMEAAGAEKVTIFGPAVARDTWPEQATTLFKEGSKPDVFTIERIVDLKDPRAVSSKYIFISTELLSQSRSNPELRESIDKLVTETRGTDGVILDESDDFKNPKAVCSEFLMDMVEKLRINNKKKFMIGDAMPILALTATPINTGELSDMDVIMGILYPGKFSLPGRVNGQPLFSQLALNDPRLAHNILFGEKLMLRWTVADMYDVELPNIEPERIRLKMSPAEQVLYDWIASLPVEDTTNLVRTALLNPEILKPTLYALQEKGVVPVPKNSRQALFEKFKDLHSKWQDWMLGEHGRVPGSPEEPFSADWIAKMGENEFLIECFLHRELINGIEDFAQELGHAFRDDWQPAQEASTKFLAARDMLKQWIVGNDKDGYGSPYKIMFVSPYRRQGITRNMFDDRVHEEDWQVNTFSFYERMHMWFPGLPADFAVPVDGTKGFKRRRQAAEDFRLRGDRNIVTVATLDSIKESMNWAVADTDSNRNIEAIKVIYFGWPLGWDEVEQFGGRFPRPGLAKRVEFYVLEVEDTIDDGNGDLVLLKKLYQQLVLSGVELTAEEKKFFDKNTKAERILVALPTVGQRLLQTMFQNMKAVGEQGARLEFAREQEDGRTLGQVFAELYFDEGNDEWRLVGNNAQLVTDIIAGTNPKKVLSIGAGSCLLARKMLKEGSSAVVDNVDINAPILQTAKERYPGIGEITVEGASALSAEKNTYDAVDNSFMLHWTYPTDEDGKIPEDLSKIDRVRVLTEMNRVLRPGGTAVITVPESTFDTETFGNFIRLLERHFGFEVVKEQSGTSYAVDLVRPKRLGWIIRLKKVRDPHLEHMNPEHLFFLSDPKEFISHYKPNDEDQEPKVVTVEYPLFDSHQFRIHNPLTADAPSSTVGSASRVDVMVDVTDIALEAAVSAVVHHPPEDPLQLMRENLRSLEHTSLQYTIWRRTVHELQAIYGCGEADAEEYAILLYAELEHGFPSEWDVTNNERLAEIHGEITSRLLELQREQLHQGNGGEQI